MAEAETTAGGARSASSKKDTNGGCARMRPLFRRNRARFRNNDAVRARAPGYNGSRVGV